MTCSAPKHAVILAAGFGMRMVPINLETPKALLEVQGEVLIERLIKQLHEVGIEDIDVVVGFMKERFEYLIDDYGVRLVINTEYAKKNNLHSLWKVRNKLKNSYIVPCDIWCRNNPFRSHEFYPWYMMTLEEDEESEYSINRKRELVKKQTGQKGNRMVGIAYLDEKTGTFVQKQLEKMDKDPKWEDSFWEETLIQKETGRLVLPAKIIKQEEVVEINTYEQLRELDSNSSQLKSDALDVIAQCFNVPTSEIENITVLKKGMTNRSFLFSVQGQKYIMRIPGEGTDQLINRHQEADVYEAIRGKGLCDDTVYLNPANGYKVTRYLEGVRVCDVADLSDLNRCMKKLREFHNMKLQVSHRFDIFGQIAFYEQLWEGKDSVYKDYQRTKDRVFSLIPFIEENKEAEVLTHIDAVPDNFLFYKDSEGKEDLQLTDWEYAGMQDPHVDIAMFCIYSLYEKDEVDRLIDIYFEGNCEDATRTKIYCYIAACGLLWSNWCEYKSQLGVEFGEYALKQYRYAKEYYKYAKERI